MIDGLIVGANPDLCRIRDVSVLSGAGKAMHDGNVTEQEIHETTNG